MTLVKRKIEVIEILLSTIKIPLKASYLPQMSFLALAPIMKTSYHSTITILHQKPMNVKI